MRLRQPNIPPDWAPGQARRAGAPCVAAADADRRPSLRLGSSNRLRRFPWTRVSPDPSPRLQGQGAATQRIPSSPVCGRGYSRGQLPAHIRNGCCPSAIPNVSLKWENVTSEGLSSAALAHRRALLAPKVHPPRVPDCPLMELPGIERGQRGPKRSFRVIMLVPHTAGDDRAGRRRPRSGAKGPEYWAQPSRASPTGTSPRRWALPGSGQNPEPSARSFNSRRAMRAEFGSSVFGMGSANNGVLAGEGDASWRVERSGGAPESPRCAPALR